MTRPDPSPIWGAYVPERMPSGRPWPRITVVTATFNRARMLETTIKSVLAQGYPNLEYIVIDGGSTDCSVDVIRKYSEHLFHWESEKDSGQSHAINKGLARSTGQLLTWLNDDDTLEPDALFSIALAYDEDAADLIVGLIRVMENGTPVGLFMTSVEEGRLPLSEMLDIAGTWSVGKFFFQPEVVFTRDIWEKAGGRLGETLHYSMDYDLWCRMAAAAAVVKVIGKPICAFLVHAQQKTTNILGTQHAAVGDLQSKSKQELGAHAWTLSKRFGVPPKYRVSGAALPRICLVSDFGFLYGAGIANRRIAIALATAGHDVKVLALCAGMEVSGEEVRRPKISEVIARIRRFRADLVIVANIHFSGMPPALVAEIGRHFPTFLITHDLWWLTGRSAYPLETRDPLKSHDEDAQKWAEYPRTLPGHVEQLRAEKEAVLASSYAPTILANSRWSHDVFRRSLEAMGSRARIVRFSIPVPDSFRPHDKAECRREFDLPNDKFIVAASAASLSEERKGVRLLLDAVRLVNDPDIGVAFVGLNPEFAFDTGFETFAVGVIDDEARLSRFYAAADLVVSASSMETLGQTLLEASASGVPTVAFAGSGTEDAVKDGVTGVTVKEISAEALASAIRELKANAHARADMAFWGPRFVANEFSIYKCYHSLYRAFEEAGLYLGGNFKRKIDFGQDTERDIEVETLGHGISIQRYHGMSDETGPYEPLKIDRYRWIQAHEASVEIRNFGHADRRKIILALRNYRASQRLQVLVDDSPCIDASVHSDFSKRQVFEFDVWIPAGDSRIRINTTEIKLEDGEPGVVLLEDFLIV